VNIHIKWHLAILLSFHPFISIGKNDKRLFLVKTMGITLDYGFFGHFPPSWSIHTAYRGEPFLIPNIVSIFRQGSKTSITKAALQKRFFSVSQVLHKRGVIQIRQGFWGLG
jgi:hypothetical protein